MLPSVASFLFVLLQHKIDLAAVAHLLVMNRLYKIEFTIFISLMWPLVAKDLTGQNLFIFTAACAVTCGDRKKPPSASS